MDREERQSAMKLMMEQMFGGMDLDEKKEMCTAMMSKMTEGVDMKELMPKMMTGAMTGEHGDGFQKMHSMMSGNEGGANPQGGMMPMPEMMLKMMMPHCIGMMLPAIDPDKRPEAATAILSAVVENGTKNMSEEQKKAYMQALSSALAS
jgi:hypothetical protein